MRKCLHFLPLLLGTILLTTQTHAQNDRFAFAVTGLEQTGAGWNALRKLDLSTGEYTKVLLNGIDAEMKALDATTKRPFISIADAKFGNYLQAPFSTGVAAMAYDKKNNRLYFTPMFIDQLRYIDLKTMKVYYVTDQSFTGFGNMHNDEGKIITRMTIAPDGNGYALTNDANSFIQFTTGKKLRITQLGSLVDDPSNSGISIQNRCSSWGGDMIADDSGNLYILTARNSVFKVAIATKVAKHLGYIKGLPQDFTTNGAVVNNEGKILASSAVNTKAWYVIDPQNWTATAYAAANGIYRSSDLANSNYLQTKPRNTTPSEILIRKAPGNIVADKIMIYPNPVTNNQFIIQFGKIPAGNYNVDLTDVMGRTVLRRTVNISAEDQVETVSISPASAKGVYLVKVIDQNSKSVFTQKLVVQ
ncbi:MAG: T9SS type A sorting domain-containing protein [Chitinophagaceae bacterium]|nr:MAG: T9SS type A sorting domain-containing protein [Chitinophagaceae bacterium]